LVRRALGLAFVRRALGRALVRRALARPSLVDATGATGVLATMAFLVVFRVLIRDFF
jgi:hypothetical protein